MLCYHNPNPEYELTSIILLHSAHKKHYFYFSDTSVKEPRLDNCGDRSALKPLDLQENNVSLILNHSLFAINDIHLSTLRNNTNFLPHQKQITFQKSDLAIICHFRLRSELYRFKTIVSDMSCIILRSRKESNARQSKLLSSSSFPSVVLSLSFF